uniref:Uncharacterized protein n=1 Tax=Anser brachyrhynchus TaxID=132585 RepID=A0A8B9C4C6_9AVES
TEASTSATHHLLVHNKSLAEAGIQPKDPKLSFTHSALISYPQPGRPRRGTAESTNPPADTETRKYMNTFLGCTTAKGAAGIPRAAGPAPAQPAARQQADRAERAKRSHSRDPTAASPV